MATLSPSFRERPAEQAAEAGLRGDHALPEGRHAGVGEDAGNAWARQNQVRQGGNPRSRGTG